MKIRNANVADIPQLLEMLDEIRAFHQAERPDIFKSDGVKFDKDQLMEMLSDESQAIFVAEVADKKLSGYAMCQLKLTENSSVLLPAKVLYLDDLFVAKEARKEGLGQQLLEACKDFARAENCTRLELNVWEFPDSALHFYEKSGFTTQRREMELPL